MVQHQLYIYVYYIQLIIYFLIRIYNFKPKTNETEKKKKIHPMGAILSDQTELWENMDCG